MKHYLWWVPAICLMSILTAWLSVKNNGAETKFYFYLIWALGLIPLWGIISCFSKSIQFDGMLYDILMFFSYSVFLGVFSKSFDKFSLLNYVGLVSIIVGFVFLKIK